MTKAALARVIGANKVRRHPFKAGARSAASRSHVPSPGATQPAQQPARAPSPQPGIPQASGPKQPGHKSNTGQHRVGAALC